MRVSSQVPFTVDCDKPEYPLALSKKSRVETHMAAISLPPTCLMKIAQSRKIDQAIAKKPLRNRGQ